MITVPTTASRFALLQIDSDSDSDASDAGKIATKGGRDASGKPRPGKAGAAGAKAGQCGDKKKDKKKKRREQQQSEATEVRDTVLGLRDAAGGVHDGCAPVWFHFT